MLFRACCATSVILAAVSLGLGQMTGGSKESDQSEQKRPEVPSAWQRHIDAQAVRMARALKLDDAQTEQVKVILTKQYDAIRQLNVQEAVPKELREQIQAVARELGEATKAGDQQRVKELRERHLQLGKQAREAGQAIQAEVEALRDASHEQILAILRADQISSFDAFWERNMTRGFRSTGRARNPVLLKRLVGRLPDLTDEQKKKVDALFRAYNGATPTSQKSHVDTPARLEKLFDDVYAVLTEKQREAVQEKIERRPGSAKRSRPVQLKKPKKPPAEGE